MSILGLDLGGTKLASALFSSEGALISKEVIFTDKRKGGEVGEIITRQVKKYMAGEGSALQGIGVSVPGISHRKTGTVWAPNIEGWEDYPLLNEIKEVAGAIPVVIDSDRVCCILGEQWQGNAKDCLDAICLSVGTGIGAGILVNGNILRGANDIGGAVGWLALQKPYEEKYIKYGCFEYYASGDGIVRLSNEVLADYPEYNGVLKKHAEGELTARHVFDAFENSDPVAVRIMHECIGFWGMAAANFISIFNPEKIIFGGGVFGPATKWISSIKEEAAKWAQPISMQQVSFHPSGLQGEAAIYGAACMALKDIQHRQ